MYKAKLWDEDKWNIHSSSYNSSKYANTSLDEKKDDKRYHEQKYGSKEKDVSSDYIRRGEEKEDKDRKIFDNLEEEKKEQDIKEDEITFKAAKQLFSERRYETKKIMKRKNLKTIDDAIKKAIEEEKNVIIIDN